MLISDVHAARVPLPDERFNWLIDLYKPVSKVPAYLEVWDIAGLVRGASEGEGLCCSIRAACVQSDTDIGLGNAFLSNISSVDGIFHVVRIFEDADVTHVEGSLIAFSSDADS